MEKGATNTKRGKTVINPVLLDWDQWNQYKFIILVVQCCYNKVSQCQWLKTVQIYNLIVLYVRSSTWVTVGEIKASKGLDSFLETLMENVSPVFTNCQRPSHTLAHGPFPLSSKPVSVGQVFTLHDSDFQTHISYVSLLLLPYFIFKDPC